MAKGEIVVDVRGVPECVWAARHALAQHLRASADLETQPYTASRLREIAAAYEAGSPPESQR